MIGRRIPPADMAKWLVCVALDGGLREGDHQTQVVLIHDRGSRRMENFMPADYETELNAQAFKDPKLGEFTISSYPVEDIVSKDDYMADVELIRKALSRIDDEGKRITLLAMQPLTGGNFRQEILGYSLMTALGIKADEIKP